MTGSVALVGAGIGNSGLITLEGLRAIKNAEVVVYDRLLGEGVMELIPQNAEKINAGKKSAHHTLPQTEINKILIEKAKEGKRVVRLKGGDSYLFGRGGEEALALFEANIPFRVIPGVSSAFAAPALVGIPVTHRDISSSVHIFTAHGKNGKTPDIDFKSCAGLGGTLIFLMGIESLEYIVRGLILGGMREDMPCAAIEKGGTSEQKKIVSTLGNILWDAKHIKSPAIIVVGEVCRLSSRLDVSKKLPLKGKRIVITRPYESAVSLAVRLRELGAYAEILPCISRKTINANICEDIKSSKTVTFTSPAGVSYAFELIFGEGKDLRIFAEKQVAAVGIKTAEKLFEYGIKADIVPREESGEGLAAELIKKELDNILILRALNGAEGLIQKLDANKISYTEKAVYKTEIIDKSFDRADYVVFASPSEVSGFLQNKKNYIGVAAGKTTLDFAKKCGINCILAASASDADITEAILRSENNDKQTQKAQTK